MPPRRRHAAAPRARHVQAPPTTALQAPREVVVRQITHEGSGGIVYEIEGMILKVGTKGLKHVADEYALVSDLHTVWSPKVCKFYHQVKHFENAMNWELVGIKGDMKTYGCYTMENLGTLTTLMLGREVGWGEKTTIGWREAIERGLNVYEVAAALGRFMRILQVQLGKKGCDIELVVPSERDGLLTGDNLPVLLDFSEATTSVGSTVAAATAMCLNSDYLFPVASDNDEGHRLTQVAYNGSQEPAALFMWERFRDAYLGCEVGDQTTAEEIMKEYRAFRGIPGLQIIIR